MMTRLRPLLVLSVLVAASILSASAPAAPTVPSAAAGDARFAPTLGPDGRMVAPLVGGEGPAWLTPEVAEKAKAAGKLGLAYDADTDQMVDLAAAYPTQALVRPGTQIFPESILPGWCTAAFTFGSEWQISTAGHCTDAGDAVFLIPYHKIVSYFGITSVSTGNGGIGNDWALIDVLPSWRNRVDSDVAWVGGPHGVADYPYTLLKHVGHGTAVGTGGTPRLGFLLGWEPNYVTFDGQVQRGDSGSPLLQAFASPGPHASDDDAFVGDPALGIITHGTCGTWDCILVEPPYYATRIDLVGTPDDGDFLPAL